MSIISENWKNKYLCLLVGNVVGHDLCDLCFAQFLGVEIVPHQEVLHFLEALEYRVLDCVLDVLPHTYFWKEMQKFGETPYVYILHSCWICFFLINFIKLFALHSEIVNEYLNTVYFSLKKCYRGEVRLLTLLEILKSNLCSAKS